MPSLCPICQEHFAHWAEYHEHISLFHGVHPTAQQSASVAPRPIEKREWKGPMDKAEKRRLVERGEARVGRHFFIGGDL